jgi:hypothetical protein
MNELLRVINTGQYVEYKKKSTSFSKTYLGKTYLIHIPNQKSITWGAFKKLVYKQHPMFTPGKDLVSLSGWHNIKRRGFPLNINYKGAW